MKLLHLSAPIRLIAGAAGKPRRFKILAYTGGALNVDGFDLPVVVDLAGLRASDVAIVLNHDATTDATVGMASEIDNDGRRLVLAGPITGSSDQVRRVIDQADAGHRWQASIGANVEVQERIAEGRVVTVNGQQFEGPIIVARQSELRHTGILPNGADSATSVNLAAAAATSKGSIMDFATWCKDQLGIDPDKLTEAGQTLLMKAFEESQKQPAAAAPDMASASGMVNLRAERAADHRRIAQIELIALKHPSIAATAIEQGWSPDRTEIAVLKASLRTPAPSNYRDGAGGPDDTQVLEASFAMTCGASPALLAKSMGETVVDSATRKEHRGASLHTVFTHVMRAAGVAPPANRITDEFIRAGFQASRMLEASQFSTVNLPGILSNSANKLLLEGYGSIKATWREFCAIGNLQDLKQASRYRMNAAGDFDELAPGDNIKMINLTSEDTYTIQGKTYANVITLSRTSIINDDLSAFETLPKIIGRKAATKLEKVIYALLMANSGSFFGSGNGNLLTGGGSALGITALSTAEKTFLNMTDINGDPVLITPEILLVPTTLSVTANQLVRDTQVVAIGVGATAAVTPNGNPHAGKFEAIVSPWLENANLTGYSTAKWYLLARPQGTSGLIEVGFLNGQETPTIDNGELDFTQLGIALRGYHDWGVAFQDPKYGVRNDGA